MAGRVRTFAGLTALAVSSGCAFAALDPARAEPPPSAELLLFLAEFHDAAGEAVDPIDLDQQPARQGASGKSDAKLPRVPAKSEPDEPDLPPTR